MNDNVQPNAEGALVPPQTSTNVESSAQGMINAALSQGAGIEVIKELMELYREEREYDAGIKFTNAMSLARSEFMPIIKKHMVDYGGNKAKFKHEDIPDIAKSVDPALSAHGFVYDWDLKTEENGDQTVTFVISHIGGKAKRRSMTAPPDKSGGKNDLQARASTTTYLQRYTMRAGLGLAIGKDTDGVTVTPDEPISAQQVEEIKRLVLESEINPEVVTNYYRVETFPEIPISKYNEIVGKLNFEISKKKKGESSNGTI